MADAGFNPFSGIDANIPSTPSGNSGWAQQLFANNPVSTSRYNFTPLNYQAPSFSSGPSLASSLIPSNAGSSSANGGNSGGFLSGIGNFFSGLGNDIYNGYEHLKGAFEGAFNPALQQNADLAKTLGPLSPNNPNVIFDGHGLRYKDATTPNFLDQIGNIAKGTWNGLINPTQAQQSFNQNLSTTSKDSPGTGLGSFALQVATDPLTYVPVGTVARATGVTPALKFGYDWLKGAVKGADAVGNIAKDIPADQISNALKNDTNLNELQNEIKNLETQHSTVSKDLLNTIKQNYANNNVFDQLKTLGVRRPLQGDAYYTEFKGLPASAKNVFQPGNLGKGAISLDEAASSLNKNVHDLLNELSAGKKSFSYQDIANHPQISDLRDAISTLKQTRLNYMNDLVNQLKTAGEETAATSATKAPYAAYNWQSKIGEPIANALTKIAPDGVPIARNILDNKFTQQLGKNFIKFYGTSPEVENSLREMSNAKNADLQNIVETMGKLASTHGLNESEMNDVVHMFEGLPVTNTSEKVTQAYNDLKDVLENGINTPTGRVLGTQSELNTMYNGKPLLENVRDNYYPHTYNESLTDKLMNATKNNAKVFSTKGASNKERVFDTVLDAKQAGFKPEMNPYIAIGQRLAESSQKLRNAEALNRILDSGALSDEMKSGLVPSTIPQLMGKHMTQNDLNALKSYMGGDQRGEFMKLYDKGMGGWKKFSLMNSLVHGHNVAYNGMWLGGANPSYVLDTMKNLAKKNDDEWYQRALRAGAVSSDRGQFLDNLKSSINNVSHPIRDKISYALHGALWDFDKAMRTAIFRDAIENGATETEAAAKANKFLTNYNNLTPFEEKVMTRIFPFYRWMKGNMPLQVEQWLNNTPKQVIYEHAKNSINQSLTGQDIGSDGKIDTGIVLKDGSHVKIDPYSPADEPIKALTQGIVPFLYGKQNPILKEIETQATNHAYYPEAMFAPNGKESMANSLIRNPGAPSSDNVRATISHIANNLNPLSGGALGNVVDTKSLTNNLMGVNSNKQPKPPQTGAEIITRLLGGFPSRDNPALDDYYQQKDGQQHIKDQISYMRKQGQQIPKSMNQQAYKKIPFPIAGQ